MGSSKACWQGPVLRHLAGFKAFGKGFYARRNCENAGMAGFSDIRPTLYAIGSGRRELNGDFFLSGK
jgi:hypothetical protein